MLHLLGAAALCACFAGWFVLLQRRLALPAAAVPFWCFAALTCFLYLGGLLNLLPLFCWLALLGGLGALVLEGAAALRAKRLFPRLVRPWLAPGPLFMALVLVAGLFLLRGGSLSQVDDFTHWAAMVKEMVLFGRLPNFDTRLIYHQNYPPATSLFQYFIIYFVGLGDVRLLFAQLLLYAAPLCLLFLFLRPEKKNWPALLLTGLGAVWLLGGGGIVSLSSLMVDTQIALFSLAATLLIWYCRQDAARAALYSCPLMVMATLTKSSGLFFVALNTVLLLVLALGEWRAVPRPRRWAKKQSLQLLWLAMPYLCLMLWNSHVDMVYQDAAMSRHAMRLDTMLWTLSAREEGALPAITRTFFSTSLSFGNHSLVVLLAVTAALVLAGLLCFKTDKKTAKNTWWLALGANVVYWLYMLAVLATYLLTMWYEDVNQLPAYDRYCSTVALYLGGLCTAVLCGLLQRLQNPGRRAGAVAVGAALVLCLWVANGNPLATLRPKPYAQNTALRIARDQPVVMENYGYHPLDYKYSFLVYLGGVENQVDSNVFRNMLCYNLLTRNVELIEAEDDLEEWRAKLEDHYFLLVLDVDERITAFLQDYGVQGAPEPFYLMEGLLEQAEKAGEA